MFAYYKKLSSEVYDLDKPIGRSFGDVEFYRERLLSCKGPILEPGVGTGRIIIPLLEAGLNVIGFDVSTDMLQICRKNCAERGLDPILLQERMESFSFEENFDAIIVPTGTFLLVHKREDSVRALKNFYDHLTNGGRLILDIFLHKELQLNKESTRYWYGKNGDLITLQTKVVEIDYVNQFSISHHRYEKWRNGKLIATELERFPLRWYGIEEFKLLLENIGFEHIQIFTDYQVGNQPTNTTEIITFEAIAIK